MIPKLTLKTNTMGISIILSGLCVPICGKSGGKMKKNTINIFKYFFIN